MNGKYWGVERGIERDWEYTLVTCRETINTLYIIKNEMVEWKQKRERTKKGRNVPLVVSIPLFFGW